MYFHRKCKITFICHGATIYSEEGRLSDALNYPPLSESGVEEIEALAKYLKARGVKNDAIYTSPSIRTAQSAMMIAKLFKKDYITVDKLYPRQYGTLNGMTIEKLINKYPEGFTEILLNPDVTQGGTESSSDLISRVNDVIEELVEQNIGNRIIIVTHPEIIQAAICAALEIPADKLSKIFIRTGSATQISYFDNWASLVYSDYTPL